MAAFARATAWLAGFVLGLPLLGLALMVIVLGWRRGWVFSFWFLVLMVLAFVVALIPLAVLRVPTHWVRALIAAVIVYGIALVFPLTHAMASYPIHVLRCGGLPLVATDFAAARSYRLPGDDYYSVTPLDSVIFCTEAEAQAERYHRAPI
ncbi:hypothetical protein [Nonomuraea sp. NPDC049709]|uniref:hypothetical protein n=1 Tax=Nonomuraea sp. NPDC049709 TaxID=3154736 RepID=UPI00343183DE